MKVEIDCLGDICPIPYIKATKELNKLDKGDSVLIITDHSCVARALVEKLGKDNYIIEEDEVMNGVWEITVTKN